VTSRLAPALLAFVAATATAAAQPMPMAPPVAAPPVPATGSTISPLLTRPGPVIAAPAQPVPVYPAMPSPGPIDQQKSQSYRGDLSDQLRTLDNEGVSPGSEQYRDLQEELNRPGR
jgi:hypothetical protein